ncbi:hypothetical protein EPUS_05712 [Endocarpon pusillum Z07020]|uniref:Uncharacterized protein n=1 Tax=Endocarpon pusillum (strain Z07020 / HMAS-L-300199) TaxID=1263415 RepID=U1GKF5_ENDPU|nr:uncharacterized protein EPUS_05712 [Endocarpon pusillum Z07020]ERF72658.1 hypothetical protein EPUS_05712 [Endocarpon pusillum Z07020]
MDLPHEKGIMLTEPPVCDRCIDSPDSIAKLEQHALVLREDPEASQKAAANERLCKIRQPAVEIGNRRNTIPTRIEEKQSPISQLPFHKGQPSRPLPAWMSLLPSNVNPHVKPPSRSILSRRMSFPSYSSFSKPIPYMTLLEPPISHDDYTSSHPPTPPNVSLDGDITPRASAQRERHNSSNNVYTSSLPSQSPIASSITFTIPYGLHHHATSSEVRVPTLYFPTTIPIKSSNPEPPFSSGQPRQKCLNDVQESKTLPQTQSTLPQSTNSPPFMEELSSFLTSRSAETKLILPSRALQKTRWKIGLPKVGVELGKERGRDGQEEEGCYAVGCGGECALTRLQMTIGGEEKDAESSRKATEA